MSGSASSADRCRERRIEERSRRGDQESPVIATCSSTCDYLILTVLVLTAALVAAGPRD